VVDDQLRRAERKQHAAWLALGGRGGQVRARGGRREAELALLQEPVNANGAAAGGRGVRLDGKGAVVDAVVAVEAEVANPGLHERDELEPDGVGVGGGRQGDSERAGQQRQAGGQVSRALGLQLGRAVAPQVLEGEGEARGGPVPGVDVAGGGGAVLGAGAVAAAAPRLPLPPSWRSPARPSHQPHLTTCLIFVLGMLPS